MKLIKKDSKSTNSNEFVIVEQVQYKALEEKKSGEPLKLELTGGFYYVVYHLDKPGVLNGDATFEEYFRTLKEAKKKYPDVDVIKLNWKVKKEVMKGTR